MQNSWPNKTERERKENAKESVEINIERKREISKTVRWKKRKEIIVPKESLKQKYRENYQLIKKYNKNKERIEKKSVIREQKGKRDNYIALGREKRERERREICRTVC